MDPLLAILLAVAITAAFNLILVIIVIGAERVHKADKADTYSSEGGRL